MPTLKARDRKQEAGPCDETDTKQSQKAMSALDLRVRSHCYWDPLTSKQVRYLQTVQHS